MEAPERPIPVSSQSATSPALVFGVPGTYALTATYSGDANYSAATLSGPTLNVTLPTIAVTPSPSTISLASGASTGNTSTLTVSTPNGYTGAVTLACAMTSTLSSVTNPPTCSLTPSTIAITGESATTVLTLTTTLPHAISTTVAQARPPATPHHPAAPVAIAAACLILVPFSRRALRGGSPLTVVLLLLLAPAAALTVTGCSASLATAGTPASTAPTSPVLVGTTPGAYAVTITATPSVGAATSTTLTLTVQ